MVGRAFVLPLLTQLRRARREPHRLLFPVQLPEYSRRLHAAATRLRLEPLKLTPHTARHGGASEDYYRSVRDIASIQARGRWESSRSVARYRKPGKLCRQIERARLLWAAPPDLATRVEKRLLAWAKRQC